MHLFNAEYGDVPPDRFKVKNYDFSASDIRSFLLKIAKNENERNIDEFLRSKPSLFAFASKFFSSGHHGNWVIPQAAIKPPGINGKGLIPDYLFASQNSDGITWWVVELKSPGDKLYKSDSSGTIVESAVHAKALRQLKTYVQFCDEHQSYIRDTLGLKSFTRPYGVLICGRESELKNDFRKQNAKAAFNRDSKSFQVRTYDAYIHQLRYMIELTSKFPNLNNLFVNVLSNSELSPFDYEQGVENT